MQKYGFLGAISRYTLQSFFRKKPQKRIFTAIGARNYVKPE